mgnify:FL=1
MIYHDKAIANTFGLEAVADTYIEYGSVEELACEIGQAPRPFLHVGGGSNLLFAVRRFSGTVFHNAAAGIKVLSCDSDGVLLKVGGGLIWDEFVQWCVAQGYYGAENLSLIPGEAGAAAVQNIGAYGAEAGDIVECVEAFDTVTGSKRTFSRSECRYGYRSSFFKTEEGRRFFVLSVTFRLGTEPRLNLSYGPLKELENPTLEQVRARIVAVRREKLPDPAAIGSAGSFFKNPVVPQGQYEALAALYSDMPHYPAAGGTVKLSAGWLIDRCGYKGFRKGRAGVYDKQALVLVNFGGATAAEIISLADEIAGAVSKKFGVDLQAEVQVVK